MKSTFTAILGVALACLSTPAIAQSPATWAQPVNVTASEGTLTKTGGCDMCPDAGAYSQARLADAGYAEFVPASGHRLAVGLTTEAIPPTNGLLVDYSVSLWPTGTFEIRERGEYRGEGTFAQGDRFRIAIESGKIVYRRNGAVIRSSLVAPTGPLALAVTLATANAAVRDAVLYLGADFDYGEPEPPPLPPPPPPPPPAPELPSGIVSVGPYRAIIERLPHAKPALPALGPAGTSIVDAVFGSRILRVTDAATRPGALNRSYRSPSSPHQNAWSARGSYFYVVSGDGSVLPFAFDAATGTASRLQPTTTGSGGLVLNFYVEPQFSYVTDSLIYGSPSSARRAIDQYDFTTGTYTRLLDLDGVVPGLTDTYIGGLASSAGLVERIAVMFGGTAQDRHHYVVMFEKENPQNRLLLDTHASTVNGAATSIPLAFSLHHVAMDRSGRYVMLYPTWADFAAPRFAAQSYLWDTATGAIAELGVETLPYGHDAFGYGVSVNQDCCVATSWDAAQWQLRSLAAPLTTQDLIKYVLLPKEIALAEHSTWNNARPDRLVPFVSALFRSPASGVEWRAWDDEIVAVQTDAGAADATVWRFAHHRSNTWSDIDPSSFPFWYQPRPNVSIDGRWVMFTSNWEKTLGTDPTGDATTSARQDVFIVELRPASELPADPPPAPVAIAAAEVPGGRATVPYTASLTASGGSGIYLWSVGSGALPAGLTLNPASGAITGTPTAAGTFTVGIGVSDAANPANTTTASFAIAIAPAVSIASPSTLPAATRRQPYSHTLVAANGVGPLTWTVTGGALPPGMTLDAATGTIAGTCLRPGRSSFTVRVADSTTGATAALSIKVQ